MQQDAHAMKEMRYLASAVHMAKEDVKVDIDKTYHDGQTWEIGACYLRSLQKTAYQNLGNVIDLVLAKTLTLCLLRGIIVAI